MNRPLKQWEVLSSIALMAPATVFLWASSACATPLPSSSSDQAETVTPQQFFRDLSPTPKAPVNSLQTASITVNRIAVVGSTILSAADFTPITKPLERQPITLAALHQAADEMTQLYLKRGFVTSRVILPPQTLNEGVVTLQVIEGWLGDIQVQGNRQLRQSYIKSRLRLAAGSPLNLQRIEAQIRLLNTDPLLEHVEASLRAGHRPGESILIVKVKEADRYSSSVSTDNYNSSKGLPEKTRLSASYLNPTGLGDELSVSSSLGSQQNNDEQ
jgi:hemolysin activation/secretion protein